MTGSGSLCQVVGASVRGASHVRADKPNQDAIGWEADDHGGHLIVCVADGHGSKKCFRSHVGSQLAVAAGLEVGRRFLDRVGGAGDAATARRRASESLPAALVAEWRRRVADDLAASPLRADELEGVDEADRDVVAETPVLAYGATLLAVLFSPAWVLVVQVGDGDVLFVSPAGQTSRPVPRDARLIGNETTSLSAPAAEDDFRLAAVPLGPDGPAMVIVATDGFGNAYADDASFLKVGSDVLAKVKAEGMESVDGELETWLSSASSYDGDDTSAVIVSVAAAKPPGAVRPSATSSGAVPFEIERRQVAAAGAPPPAAPGGRPWLVPALLVAVLLLAVGGAALFVASRSSDEASPVLLSTADGSVVVGVTSGETEPVRRMDGARARPPVSRLASAGVMWEVGPDGRIRGVQGDRGVVLVVQLPEPVVSIGVGGQWLWALAEAGDLVYRVDVATGRCVATFAVKGNAAGSTEPARTCQG